MLENRMYSLSGSVKTFSQSCNYTMRDNVSFNNTARMKNKMRLTICPVAMNVESAA